MRKSHCFDDVSTTLKCAVCQKPIKKRFETQTKQGNHQLCFTCFGITERQKGHVMQHIIPKGMKAPRAKFRIGK